MKISKGRTKKTHNPFYFLFLKVTKPLVARSLRWRKTSHCVTTGNVELSTSSILETKTFA